MTRNRHGSSKRFSIKAEIAKLPKSIVPIYTTSTPNEIVLLYEGPLALHPHGKGKPFQALGKVYLRWQPTPKIEFEALGVASISKAPAAGTIELTGLRRRAGFFITARGGELRRLRGVVTEPLSGYLPRTRSQEVASLVFHVPNTSDLLGERVADGMGWRGSRLSLRAGDWVIVLDSVADHDTLQEKLNEQGGYAFTATGRIAREDGSLFDPEQATKVIASLHWFLSFLWGKWTGPTLLIGIGAKGKKVWERWGAPKLDPWSHVQPWMPQGDPKGVTQAFAGAHRLLESSLWNHTLRLAIHWYVEALNQAGAVHGGIMMAQTAFELLWWTVFVGEGSIVHEPDKVIAADKIRLLLHHYGIPASIPVELTHLAKEAKARGWPDGPTAITQIRNALVHPAKGRMHRPAPEGEPVFDAWKLAIWYLELTLLAVTGYRGVYSSRLQPGANVYDTTKVPWAP